MPGQRQISAFFKPLATPPKQPKRLLSTEDAEQPIKKLRSEGSPENKTVCLAIDIEKKRLMAKVKLQSRATPIVPADIGLSWFGALEQEFTKEYFVKLNSFVQEERRKFTVYPSHENVFSWTKSCEVNKSAPQHPLLRSPMISSTSPGSSPTTLCLPQISSGTRTALLPPGVLFRYNGRLRHGVKEDEDGHLGLARTGYHLGLWLCCSCKYSVRVVILGQDPYHNPGQAHGLAFSVPKGVAIPMSLLNMYKELANDIPGFQQPSHGNLTGWAQQGVLLLNACLTVRMNTPNSHKDRGWENLTDAVIRHLNKQCSNLVFLLWGAYAQKKGSIIDRKKHQVLQCAHPSPLSASRGFFGCCHFSKANEYLTKHHKQPIDWSCLP
ncbi:uracil-DNA glycosylase-like isoform X2 [Dermacentor albipictus]|uniref:uracil-DNA glycosylase-like isoform X2 n=1 Tax=Dermacentor albipictus TaxID=60249 RepID=UPI0031FCD60E